MYPDIRSNANRIGKLVKVVSVWLLFTALVAPQANAPRELPVDLEHSTVGFAVPILGGLAKVTGKFTDFAVTLRHDETEITRSSVTVVIKAASINTGIEQRDAHLRTADFFDVQKYPEITFQSDRVEKRGNQQVAVGPLTMRGVTKQIELPFTIREASRDTKAGTMTLAYAARTVLDRRDFGITWQHQQYPNYVGDKIEIAIDLLTKTLPVSPQ